MRELFGSKKAQNLKVLSLKKMEVANCSSKILQVGSSKKVLYRNVAALVLCNGMGANPSTYNFLTQIKLKPKK